jgi:hypothetical protein
MRPRQYNRGMPDTPQPPPPDPSEGKIVPEYDVTRCIVCGLPMEGRKCKYVCRSCGVMVDCSDAY